MNFYLDLALGLLEIVWVMAIVVIMAIGLGKVIGRVNLYQFTISIA